MLGRPFWYYLVCCLLCRTEIRLAGSVLREWFLPIHFQFTIRRRSDECYWNIVYITNDICQHGYFKMCDYLVFMTYVDRCSPKSTQSHWSVSCHLVYRGAKPLRNALASAAIIHLACLLTGSCGLICYDIYCLNAGAQPLFPVLVKKKWLLVNQSRSCGVIKQSHYDNTLSLFTLFSRIQ